MASKAQIEAAARVMFYNSFGGALGLYHWPGDAARPLPRSVCLFDDDGHTEPADSPNAPGGGKQPDRLREIAREMLEAAESVDMMTFEGETDG